VRVYMCVCVCVCVCVCGGNLGQKLAGSHSVCGYHIQYVCVSYKQKGLGHQLAGTQLSLCLSYTVCVCVSYKHKGLGHQLAGTQLSLCVCE
jgi:hypothetical protein